MYLGNQPALSYTSFAKQDFTTSATTSYTLDNPVTNENEIALFINFVRQEPTTAYTATNTSLTLTSATSASDDMYCVFLGKAVQTVNPPAGSVGASQISDGSIALGKLSATGTKDSTTFLRGDNSFAVPAGGVNTPAFSAKVSNGTSLSDNTATKIEFGTEVFDVGGCYNNTSSTATLNGISVPSYSFAPNVSGKYIMGASFRMNGDTDWDILDIQFGGGTIDNRFSIVHRRYNSLSVMGISSFNGTSNAVHVEGFVSGVTSQSLYNSARDSWFFAYKIIE